MSTTPRCPTCHAPVPTAVSEASPTVLVCGVCGERFQASVDSDSEPADEIPVVRPLAPPSTQPSEEPVAEAVAEEESVVAETVPEPEQVVRPVARARQVPKADSLPKAEVLSGASGRPRNAMKQTEEIPDNTPHETRIVLLLGFGCLLVVCAFLAVIGLATWFVVERLNEKAAADVQKEEAKSPPAQKPEEPSPTGLKELRAVPLPRVPDPPPNRAWSHYMNPYYTQIAYSPKHKLLFARNADGIWIYDLKTNTVVETRKSQDQFADMSLSPDESVLFVSDYSGADDPPNPLNRSRVHRYDLATRIWEARVLPRYVNRLEAVDARHFLLAANTGDTGVSVNQWGDKHDIVELSRVTDLGDVSEMVLNPRTGHVYFGSSTEAIEFESKDKKLVRVRQPEVKPGSYSIALSQDGTRLYRGKLQFDTAKVGPELRTFPEEIHAASRDIAFGKTACYSAATGEKQGEYGFRTTRLYRDGLHTVPPAITVSPDGRSVWVIDRDKNVVRQFALEDEK